MERLESCSVLLTAESVNCGADMLKPFASCRRSCCFVITALFAYIAYEHRGEISNHSCTYCRCDLFLVLEKDNRMQITKASRY